MSAKTKLDRCAISMMDFDIKTVLLTSKQQIVEILYEFEMEPDHVWCDGRGKEYMHLFLKKILWAKDQYFNDHPELINLENQDWEDFCDDCVTLYVLDAHLHNKSIKLIHPDVYAIQVQQAQHVATGGIMPDLIEGIPLEQQSDFMVEQY